MKIGRLMRFRLQVSIVDSHGHTIHHTLEKKSPTEYTVKYTPERKGDHEVCERVW